MKIELKRAVGQELTFSADEELSEIEYREIDLSLRDAAPYSLKKFEKKTSEFSITTTSQSAAKAVVELRYGGEEKVYSSRFASERPGSGSLMSIRLKLSGKKLRFQIEPYMEINGSHLELRGGGLSVRLTGDISKEVYVFGKAVRHGELRQMLKADRYLDAVLTHGIF